MQKASITTEEQARQHFLMKKGLPVFKTEQFDHPIDGVDVRCFHIYLTRAPDIIAFIVQNDGSIWSQLEFWAEYPLVS